MRIQANIAGFGGRQVTLVSVYSEDTGILAIAMEKPYTTDKLADDIVMVSNMTLPQRDWLFEETAFGDAIGAYFDITAQGKLALATALDRHRPDNKIEADTVDDRGRNYRISPDIDSGQVAVLATVAYVRRQLSARASMDCMDELAAFYGGFTI